MTHSLTQVLFALALLSGANSLPDKLVLQFETNPVADGRPGACVLVRVMDFETHDEVDFQPSSKYMAAACEKFRRLRRKMLRPGDASSFDKWPDQALWLKTEPDVPQTVSSDALQ